MIMMMMIDSMIVCVSIFFSFVLYQNVTYYCTALSAVFEGFALYKFSLLLLLLSLLSLCRVVFDDMSGSGWHVL